MQTVNGKVRLMDFQKDSRSVMLRVIQMAIRSDWLTVSWKDSHLAKRSDCNLVKPKVKYSVSRKDSPKVTPMAMTTVSLQMDSQRASLHLGKLRGYVHRMGKPTESWTVTLTDSLTAKPMAYLLKVKPKERNLDCCLVKYSENQMANRLANPMDLKMVSLRSALPMGKYLDCRLVNRMVINLECLRWDLLKANQMVIHWDCRLG